MDFSKNYTLEKTVLINVLKDNVAVLPKVFTLKRPRVKAKDLSPKKVRKNGIVLVLFHVFCRKEKHGQNPLLLPAVGVSEAFISVLSGILFVRPTIAKEKTPKTDSTAVSIAGKVVDFLLIALGRKEVLLCLYGDASLYAVIHAFISEGRGL